MHQLAQFGFEFGDACADARGFGVLEMAQALGDFQSLDRANRRAAHIHLRDRNESQLTQMAEMFGISAAKG
jgi:hypothetical protein